MINSSTPSSLCPTSNSHSNCPVGTPSDEIKPVLMLERSGPNVARYKKPQANLTLFHDEEVINSIKKEMRQVINTEKELQERSSLPNSGTSSIIIGASGDDNDDDDDDEEFNTILLDPPQKPKDYAERWEEAIKELIIAGILGDSEEANIRRDRAYEQVMTICNDFKATAVAYSKIILLEKKDSSKTIQPNDCGGCAGGIKYSTYNKIFFKFASTTSGTNLPYKSEDSAAKVSGHEIKSASHLLSVVLNPNVYKDIIPKGKITPKVEQKIKDSVVVPPLMVLIDYLGYRVIAMPVLPIGKIKKDESFVTCERCHKEVDYCRFCKKRRRGYVLVNNCTECGFPTYKKCCIRCRDKTEEQVQSELRKDGNDPSNDASTLIYGSRNCLESFENGGSLSASQGELFINNIFRKVLLLFYMLYLFIYYFIY